MTRYLLDTNALSAIIRQPGSLVEQRFAAEPIENLMTSVIVAAEARFGLLKDRAFKTAAALESLLQLLEIAPFDSPADSVYAQVRLHLEAAGTPIGSNDLLIAAHALALDATLVTANEREFRRVPGLRVENWAA